MSIAIITTNIIESEPEPYCRNAPDAKDPPARPSIGAAPVTTEPSHAGDNGALSTTYAATALDASPQVNP